MRARILTVVLLIGALLAGGCGGDDGGGEGARAAEARQQLNGADAPNLADFPKPASGQTLQALADSIGAAGSQVGLASSVFTPGKNRVAFGVLGEQNQFLYGPTVVYVARSPESTEVRGPYAAPADLLVTEPAFRSEQAATEEDPFAAVYEAEGVQLDRPGRWVVLVVTKVGDDLVPAPTEIRVTRRSPVPEVGDRAPAVETDTVAGSGGLEAIDTRRPPVADLHRASFADVVGEKPAVLLFATPQLCQSQVCGPVVDIALQLREKYGDRVEFIHQEVYVDNDPQKGLRPPLQRFGLPTEPWLFTVGADGRIAARLEGSFGLRAFERAIQAALPR
jgi:hypothetical protein